MQIAEMSSNPEIVHKLLTILDSGGLTDYGLEIKSAVVQTLAAIGNDQALPKLKEILFSVSFLHPGKHAKLKTVIIRSLPRFSAVAGAAAPRGNRCIGREKHCPSCR